MKVRQSNTTWTSSKISYADFRYPLALQLLQDLKLQPDLRLKDLSKGNKEKVQLILVMSREAKLYLLDEPIGGVDPASRDYILKNHHQPIL